MLKSETSLSKIKVKLSAADLVPADWAATQTVTTQQNCQHCTGGWWVVMLQLQCSGCYIGSGQVAGDRIGFVGGILLTWTDVDESGRYLD